MAIGAVEIGPPSALEVVIPQKPKEIEFMAGHIDVLVRNPRIQQSIERRQDTILGPKDGKSTAVSNAVSLAVLQEVIPTLTETPRKELKDVLQQEVGNALSIDSALKTYDRAIESYEPGGKGVITDDVVREQDAGVLRYLRQLCALYELPDDILPSVVTFRNKEINFKDISLEEIARQLIAARTKAKQKGIILEQSREQ